jgi:hypothetical protein
MEVVYNGVNTGNQNSDNNINGILNETNEVIITNKLIKYDHSRKMDIVKKINKIKKKEYLLDIFKILNTETKDYSENNNGIFIFFHNLSDETYEKVENYVNNIYKIHKHINNNTSAVFNSELSETFMSDTIEVSNLDKNLSNKEKMLMRRKKYEEYLTYNQD